MWGVLIDGFLSLYAIPGVMLAAHAARRGRWQSAIRGAEHDQQVMLHLGVARAGRWARIRYHLGDLLAIVKIPSIWPVALTRARADSRGPMATAAKNALRPPHLPEAIVMLVLSVGLLAAQTWLGFRSSISIATWTLVAGFVSLLLIYLLMPGGLPSRLRLAAANPVITFVALATLLFAVLVVCLTLLRSDSLHPAVTLSSLAEQARRTADLSHVTAPVRLGLHSLADYAAFVASLLYYTTLAHQIVRYQQFRRTAEDHLHRVGLYITIGDLREARTLLEAARAEFRNSVDFVRTDLRLCLAEKNFPRAFDIAAQDIEFESLNLPTPRGGPPAAFDAFSNVMGYALGLGWDAESYLDLLAFTATTEVADGDVALHLLNLSQLSGFAEHEYQRLRRAVEIFPEPQFPMTRILGDHIVDDREDSRARNLYRMRHLEVPDDLGRLALCIVMSVTDTSESAGTDRTADLLAYVVRLESVDVDSLSHVERLKLAVVGELIRFSTFMLTKNVGDALCSRIADQQRRLVPGGIPRSALEATGKAMQEYVL